MSQCHPCAINYDYIIKLETIYEDIQARFYWLGNEHSDCIRNEPIRAQFKTSTWNEYVISLMSHSTYVNPLFSQAK